MVVNKPVVLGLHTPCELCSLYMKLCMSVCVSQFSDMTVGCVISPVKTAINLAVKAVPEMTPPTRTRQDCFVSSWVCRQCEHNLRQVKTVATENLKLFCPDSKCGVNSFVLSRSSFQFATKTCLQTCSHRRQDWTKLFSLQYNEDCWKQYWLVASSVHTTNRDNTRQYKSCLVCVGDVN